MFTKTAKTYYNIEKILKWKMNEWINEWKYNKRNVNSDNDTKNVKSWRKIWNLYIKIVIQ